MTNLGNTAIEKFEDCGLTVRIEFDDYEGCYGYIVEEEGEHLDSCWGIDDLRYCIDVARDAARLQAAYREEERLAIDRMMHL